MDGCVKLVSEENGQRIENINFPSKKESKNHSDGKCSSEKKFARKRRSMMMESITTHSVATRECGVSRRGRERSARHIEDCLEGHDEENWDRLDMNLCADNECRCENRMCLLEEFFLKRQGISPRLHLKA